MPEPRTGVQIALDEEPAAVSAVDAGELELFAAPPLLAVEPVPALPCERLPV
ncbi:MAG TPA: hypothetical protein VG294_06085 [Solirubrobacteraceae bacterium]|nr:hypothetical protein [Solirubrobacteraceae bacterium]